MKKILSVLILLTVFLINIQSCKATTYKQAISESKPIAILVYADWADNIEKTITAFQSQESKFKHYNFVLLDIASEDTKIFNRTYQIYQNLPYVLLYKNNGKITRYVQRNCIEDSSCFSDKLNFFYN